MARKSLSRFATDDDLLPLDFDEGQYDDIQGIIARTGVLECGTIGDHHPDGSLNRFLSQFAWTKQDEAVAARDRARALEYQQRRRERADADWRLKNADKIAAYEAAERQRAEIIARALANAEGDIVKMYFNCPEAPDQYITAQMFHQGIKITRDQINEILSKYGIA